MATAKYEVVMIFNVNQGEEGIKALVERFTKMMKDNGTLDNVEDMGKRRLAYLIDDEAEGYYTLCNITCGPDFPAELDRVLHITDGVLRSMIVRVDEEEPKHKKQSAKTVIKEAKETKEAEKAKETEE